GLQPTGPGLAEILAFCRLVNAEPLICTRFTRRTPQDAASEVEYFNGSARTAMGRLRARNGHVQPFRIKYWQVGNERSGTEYETKLAGFCQAMKHADPSIKLLSSFPTPAVLLNAGAMLDYVCPHRYDCTNLKLEEHYINAVRGMLRTFAPKRPVRIAITEWNTTAGDWGPGRARLWSLENALHCA